ncbi:uncharacterized protein LOC106649655 isoform X2 [Trichogramma pretiosum]|uniref:uncharacterized protein LOC106649655 isoform X2 n=1 Tax=Trichogramma pretiosum TaxID=7493 RepID=UPI0006C950E1|nr:uncharacterized protein LOC106649655 isoform X2 [Trichogramma pretiosum]
MRSTVRLVFCAFLALSLRSVSGLECYRCVSTNSSRPFLCNEFLTDSEAIEPDSCDDVYGAKYCIKHVGRFEVLTLKCYQCTSADEWMCENPALVITYLEPKSCDHVFEAQYCIKTIGRYGGGIGTKRFCSSVDLGNYCEYVQQPGDKLEYRTCVYTCGSDGCNPATSISASKLIIVLLSALPPITYLLLR